jgi:hypothetical protein
MRSEVYGCWAFAFSVFAGCQRQSLAVPSAPVAASSSTPSTAPARTTEIALVLDETGMHPDGDRRVLVPLPADPSLRLPDVRNHELGPSDQPKLNLLALIVTDGIGIKGSGGNVAPGCDTIGAGLATLQSSQFQELMLGVSK